MQKKKNTKIWPLKHFNNLKHNQSSVSRVWISMKQCKNSRLFQGQLYENSMTQTLIEPLTGSLIICAHLSSLVFKDVKEAPLGAEGGVYVCP